MATKVRAAVVMLAVASGVWVAALGLHAQSALKGGNIAPAYEGWHANPDGSFELLFGYFNRSWSEALDVPIGPNNSIEPGGSDRGQPTHFLPLRSRFVFSVHVPKDFGKQEVVWTLTSNGRTERAYGTLKLDYLIDKGVIQSNYGAPIGAFLDNVAPQLQVEGASTLQARVGAPITLRAVVTDDGLPKPSRMYPIGFGVVQVPTAAMGLRFSWLVYRGAGAVTFDPPQFDAWEDYREGRNTPYSPGWGAPPVPQGNTWVTRATFTGAGTYVPRGLAHDGALATVRDLTVTVAR